MDRRKAEPFGLMDLKYMASGARYLGMHHALHEDTLRRWIPGPRPWIAWTTLGTGPDECESEQQDGCSWHQVNDLASYADRPDLGKRHLSSQKAARILAQTVRQSYTNTAAN